MDSEFEIKRLKWVLVGLVVFVVSAVFTYGEARYLLFGKSAPADVLSIKEVQERGRRGRQKTLLEVRYEFDDVKGTVRQEQQRVSTTWTPPHDNVIDVQYIPGSPADSRIKGVGEHWVFPALFFASLAFLAFKGVQFWRFYKS